MKKKMKLNPNVETSVNLKKVVLFTILGASLLSSMLYFGLTFYGVIGVPNKVKASPLTGYAFCALITIDESNVKGEEDFIDFPLLISLSHLHLRTTENGGIVESENGYDIVFTDSNNNQLPHQVESYNPITGEYNAWVKIPTLLAKSDTKIKLLYGKPSVTADPSSTTVWNGNYQGVWHMDNNPGSSVLKDMTSSGHDGAAFGSMNSSDLVAGKIGNGIDFDGSDDYFRVTNYKGITGTQERTTSFWFKSDKTNYNHRFMSWGLNVTGTKYDIRTNGGSNSFRVENAGGQKYGAINILDGNWHHLTVVLPSLSSPNVQDHLLYIDGVLDNSTAGGSQSLNTSTVGEDLLIGKSNWHCCNTSGVMDEVRVSDVALSADWIATEFKNQSDPTVFSSTTFGLSISTLPIKLTSFNVDLKDGKALIKWFTETEINNDYFTIEKSKDLVEFEFVDFIPGAGNSSGLLSYECIDDDVYDGVSYYRLKQTDFDGKYEYFSPKSIFNDNETVVNLTLESARPNPFTDRLIVDIASSISGTAEIELRNMNGVVVSSSPIQLNNGKTIYTYRDDNNLSSGMYIVSIKMDGEKSNLNVIKK